MCVCVCVCVCVCAYEDYRGTIYIQHKPSILIVQFYEFCVMLTVITTITIKTQTVSYPKSSPCPFAVNTCIYPQHSSKESALATIVVPSLKFQINVIL